MAGKRGKDLSRGKGENRMIQESAGERVWGLGVVVCFLASMFFAANRVTGYVILKSVGKGGDLWGVMFFIIGIGGLYFLTRRHLNK